MASRRRKEMAEREFFVTSLKPGQKDLSIPQHNKEAPLKVAWEDVKNCPPPPPHNSQTIIFLLVKKESDGSFRVARKVPWDSKIEAEKRWYQKIIAGVLK